MKRKFIYRHDTTEICVPLKVKIKAERILVQEMLIADYRVIVAHTADEIQVLVDKFEGETRCFSPTINIKKIG